MFVPFLGTNINISACIHFYYILDYYSFFIYIYVQPIYVQLIYKLLIHIVCSQKGNKLYCCYVCGFRILL